MKHTLLILALLIAPAAHAQTTADFAIVFGELMIPTPGAPERRVMPVLKVPYDQCDDIEIAAQTAMRAQETETAASLGYADWPPQSWALCYKEQIAIQVIPKNTLSPILCVREYSDPFDWFAPCP